MKLWIDDLRPAPEGYAWVRSVNQAKATIELTEKMEGMDWPLENGKSVHIERYSLIDIDHDSGDYARDGGDYIKLLDWLEETGRNYPIHIHSMNVVGVQNMRAIIRRNGWEEV